MIYVVDSSEQGLGMALRPLIPWYWDESRETTVSCGKKLFGVGTRFYCLTNDCTVIKCALSLSRRRLVFCCFSWEFYISS